MKTNRDKRDELLSLSKSGKVIHIIKKWDYNALDGINLIPGTIYCLAFRLCKGKVHNKIIISLIQFISRHTDFIVNILQFL